MAPWEVGLLTAMVIAATLSVIRAIFWNRWVRTVGAVMTALGVLIVGTVPAFAIHGGMEGTDWHGEIAMTATADCEWIHQTILEGNYFNPGWPWIGTVGTVDGPNNCSNPSMQAGPGQLSIRQDLYKDNYPSPGYYSCNTGPRLANDGYWTHSLSTGFGWKSVPPPCGNGYYFVNSFNYYNVYQGGPWNGNTHSWGDIDVWTANP